MSLSLHAFLFYVAFLIVLYFISHLQVISWRTIYLDCSTAYHLAFVSSHRTVNGVASFIFVVSVEIPIVTVESPDKFSFLL